MHEILDRVLEAGSQREASRLLEEASGKLEEETPEALEVLEDGLFETTAVLAWPEKYRKRVQTTNMVERLIQEIRRREKPIRIFPNKDPV